MPNPSPDPNAGTLRKAALAAAAPAVPVLAALLSQNTVDLLELFGLSRLVVASLGVVGLCLAYLLAKGRWWAGLPALLAYIGGAAFFVYKFWRPFSAYAEVNPIHGISDFMGPFMMLSPSLVLVVLSIILGLTTFKGMRLTYTRPSLPVRGLVWGLMGLWLVVLAGDAAYQSWGWRMLDHPDALTVRLGLTDDEVVSEARRRLISLGAGAVPSLEAAAATPDPDLSLLRDRSREVLGEIMSRGSLPDQGSLKVSRS